MTRRVEEKKAEADPRISAKQAWREIKKGREYLYVNIRPSRNTEYPAPAKKKEEEELLKKALPTDKDAPSPPKASIDFEAWLLENIAEHENPQLIPAPKLRDLLRKYKKVFEDLPHKLPRDRGTGHVIQLEQNAQAPYRPNRRMSPAERILCEEYVGDLLKKGFVTPSNSPFGAPIMIIAKPGGVGYRVVCDWRALKNITIKNRYPLPRIDETIDRLGGSTIFSSLDLNSGYYQIRISEEDAPKTAFTTPMGQFEFKVLGMGLANSPATFQAVMNQIFKPYLHKFVVIYLDDTLVYGKDPEEHAKNLEKVLEVLEKEEFYAKLSKCAFNRPEVKFLGHIIGKDGIKVNPVKIKAKL